MDPIFIITIIAILAPLIGAFITPLLKKFDLIRDVLGVVTIGTSAVMSIVLFDMFDGEGRKQFVHCLISDVLNFIDL